MVNLDPGGRYPTDQSNGRREAWQDPGSARHQHQGSCGQPGGIQQINGWPQRGNFNPNGSCSQPAGSNHYQTSSNGNIHDSYGQSPTSYNDTCSKRQTMNDLHGKQQFNIPNNHMPQANYNYSHPGNSRPNDYLQQANLNHNHGSNSRPNDHVQQANHDHGHSENLRPNYYIQQANHNHSHASNSSPNDHMQQANNYYSHASNSRLNDHMQQANLINNYTSNSRPSDHMQQDNHNNGYSGNPRPNGYMQQANYNHSHSTHSRPSDHMQQANHNNGYSGNPRPNNHMQQANYNHSHSTHSRPYDHLQQANHDHSHSGNPRPNGYMQQANHDHSHSGNPRPNGYMQQANHNHSHASNSKPSNHMHPDNHNHGLSGNPRSNDHNHSKEFGVTSQHSQMPLGTQNTQCGQRKGYGLNNSTNQCSEGNCATQFQHGKNQFGNGREYEQSKNNCGFNSNGQEKYWTKPDKSYCDKNQQISNNQPYPTGLNGSFQNTNKSGQPRNSWSQRRPSGGSYKPDDRTSDCSCCKSAGQLDPPMRRSSSSGPLHQEGSHQRSNFYGSHKDFYQNKSLNTHSNERKNSQEDDFFKLRQTASSHSLYNPCR